MVAPAESDVREIPAEWQKIKLKKVCGGSLDQPSSKDEPAEYQLASARKLLSPPPAPVSKVARKESGLPTDKNPTIDGADAGADASSSSSTPAPEFIGIKLKRVVKPADFAPDEPAPPKDTLLVKNGKEEKEEELVVVAVAVEDEKKVQEHEPEQAAVEIVSSNIKEEQEDGDNKDDGEKVENGIDDQEEVEEDSTEPLDETSIKDKEQLEDEAQDNNGIDDDRL